MVSAIFQALTQALQAFISTLGSGITAMTALFYADSALTVLGTLSVIVVAGSLTFWLFRLIIGLIRMRG